MDDYWAIRRASSKELQLIKAREHGIHIPDTLTTNNPAAVVDFYHKHNGNIISKMQTAFQTGLGENSPGSCFEQGCCQTLKVNPALQKR